MTSACNGHRDWITLICAGRETKGRRMGRIRRMGRRKETWQNAAKGDNRHIMPDNGHTETQKRDIGKNKKKGYTKIPQKGIIRGGKREKICRKIKSQDFPKSKICTYQKKAVILPTHSDNRPYIEAQREEIAHIWSMREAPKGYREAPKGYNGEREKDKP